MRCHETGQLSPVSVFSNSQYTPRISALIRRMEGVLTYTQLYSYSVLFSTTYVSIYTYFGDKVTKKY